MIPVVALSAPATTVTRVSSRHPYSAVSTARHQAGVLPPGGKGAALATAPPGDATTTGAPSAPVTVQVAGLTADSVAMAAPEDIGAAPPARAEAQGGTPPSHPALVRSTTTTTQARRRPAPPTTAPPTTDPPTTDPPTTDPPTTDPPTTAPVTTVRPAPRPSLTGTASWYDAPNGTCAQPNLAFGTVVTVVDVDNQSSATCTVDDRGPFTGGRIIDLSPDVFARLAPVSQGLIDVRISW